MPSREAYNYMLNNRLVDLILRRMLPIFFSIKSQHGVTMIEYALIAALVAVVVIGAITTLGTNLSSVFTYVASKVKT